MKKEYNESKIGLTFTFILIGVFVLFPYYMWYKTAKIVDAKNKDYIDLKEQVNYANKLLSKIEDVMLENQNLAISKNEYIGKYCTKINFSTKECTDYIKNATKATIEEDARNKAIAKKIFNYDSE